MAHPELSQTFADGREFEIGTPEYEEAYYKVQGEKNIFGDLSTLATPFTTHRLSPDKSIAEIIGDETTIAYIGSFLRILRMIAYRQDTHYSSGTRKLVQIMLKPFESTINEVLPRISITSDQFNTLYPLSLKWNELAGEKMRI